MKKFKLEVITPQGVYLNEEVEELYLKTSNGYQGILANHDTLVTAVDVAPGFIRNNNKKDYYAIFGGVLHINKESVKLIVSNIEHADSIDAERAKKAHERALERLKSKEVGVDTKRAELALKRSLARIGSVKKSFI